MADIIGDAAKLYMLDRYGEIPKNDDPEGGDTPAQDRWFTRFGILIDALTFLRDAGRIQFATPSPTDQREEG